MLYKSSTCLLGNFFEGWQGGEKVGIERIKPEVNADIQFPTEAWILADPRLHKLPKYRYYLHHHIFGIASQLS